MASQESNAGVDRRPLETITAVWAEYGSWARAARDRKVNHNRALGWTLLLIVAGCGLVQLGGAFENETLFRFAVFTGSVCIALSTFLGKRALTPASEAKWRSARILAEALKREAWRAWMGLDYSGIDAAERLSKKAAVMRTNLGLTNLATGPASSDEAPPKPPRTIDDYIRDRVDDQIRFYSLAGERHERRLALLNRLIFVLGSATAVLGIFVGITTRMALVLPFLATSIAAATTFIEAQRLKGIPDLYRQTATRLSYLRAAWRDSVRQRADEDSEQLQQRVTEFVDACERVLERENESWRAEWEDGKSAAELVVSLQSRKEEEQGV